MPTLTGLTNLANKEYLYRRIELDSASCAAAMAQINTLHVASVNGVSAMPDNRYMSFTIAKCDRHGRYKAT